MGESRPGFRDKKMVSLRPFADRDAAVIREKWMPDASLDEISPMIQNWGSKAYAGRCFEMLALTADGDVVGSVSQYEQAEDVASLGVEFFSTSGARAMARKGCG